MIKKSKIIKADLHFHGTIGLQNRWLNIQGYAKDNLSKMIVDRCLEEGVGMVNLVSEDFDIPKGDLRFDRFGHMQSGLEQLGGTYSYDKLGEVALIVEKNGVGKVIFTNGQCVIVNEDNKRQDHLVVGTNQVPNRLSLSETVKYCQDRGLVQIAEHPACTKHFGIGEYKFAKHSDSYDAVEGHNAQMILPSYLCWMPVVGVANKGVNEHSKFLARKYSKPYIATSDCHNLDRSNGFGSAYIQFDESLLNLSNGQNFLDSFKWLIRHNSFSVVEGYASFLSWLKWCSQFVLGHRSLPNDFLTSIRQKIA